MQPYTGKVRIIGPDELDNVMELCHLLHKENGIFTMDDSKVKAMFDKSFNKQGGILAGIGPKGKLEGLMYLLLSSFWYSNDPQWEELFLYVTPEHRRTRNAVELLNFAKWCADQTNFPLVIGILSNSPTERKEALYERQLKPEEIKGRFFIYTKKKDAVA
jgi:GNAT superfamily N-acetyltransferase